MRAKWRQKIEVCALVLISCTFVSELSAQSPPPSAEKFTNDVVKCALGQNAKISNEVVETATSNYRSNTGAFTSESKFLELFPAEQRVEAYRLYISCIQSLVNNRASDAYQTDPCEAALKRATIPMCDWWHIATETILQSGRLQQYKFESVKLPLFRFQIGSYLGEEQKKRLYSGTVFFRDGREFAALFIHDRWPTRPQSAVDYERFTIMLKPYTLPDQPYNMSYVGYFDRLSKEFVLQNLVVTLRDPVTLKGAQTALPLTPNARAVRMN